MAEACTHTDRIERTELPDEIAGCEDWFWCYEDEVAFSVSPPAAGAG